MTQAERIDDFYRKLFESEFIRTHGFERFRFGSDEFFACASTLRSKDGREITVSFNIHDEEPDEVELVMQFLNKSSLEQIRTICEQIAIKEGTDISLYQEPGCISATAYFDIEDVDGPLSMMLNILDWVSKVVLFMVKG